METTRGTITTRGGLARSEDGTDIAFERLGQGAPVVLVSGASTSRAIHASLAERLAADLTVFNYDRRGRGESGDTLPCAAEREIEDIGAVIWAAADRPRCSATPRARFSPCELRLLACPSPSWPCGSRRSWSGRTPPPTAAVCFAADRAARRRPPRRRHGVVYDDGGPAPGHDRGNAPRTDPMWPGLELLAHRLVYDATVMGDSTLPTSLISSVTVPTLILTGSDSGPWAGNAAQALTGTLPTSQHRTLDGQNHAVAWDALAPALKEFFNRSA